MAWSADFPADDWRRISASEVTRRALQRLEAKGKGMLLLHDIQPATALALPGLLRELKVRGYRVVHIVPSSAERAKTPTVAEAWLPKRRPGPAVTAFSIAAVQDPDGEGLTKKSAAELCSLPSAQPQTAIKAAAQRRQQPAAAKVSAGKVAQTSAMPDLHAAQ